VLEVGVNSNPVNFRRKDENIERKSENAIFSTYKLNSMALVRKQTIPTERPPLVGEVSANLLRIEGVVWPAYPEGR
jgi:hypothetical protein